MRRGRANTVVFRHLKFSLFVLSPEHRDHDQQTNLLHSVLIVVRSVLLKPNGLTNLPPYSTRAVRMPPSPEHYILFRVSTLTLACAGEATSSRSRVKAKLEAHLFGV